MATSGWVVDDAAVVAAGGTSSSISDSDDKAAAIIIAFLGRLHPVGVTIAALLLALMFLGGESLQMNLNLPKAVTGVFQGLLLFLVLGSDVLIRYRIRIVRPVPAKAGSAEASG